MTSIIFRFPYNTFGIKTYKITSDQGLPPYIWSMEPCSVTFSSVPGLRPATLWLLTLNIATFVRNRDQLVIAFYWQLLFDWKIYQGEGCWVSLTWSSCARLASTKTVSDMIVVPRISQSFEIFQMVSCFLPFLLENFCSF